jgi:hypothetical protein
MLRDAQAAPSTDEPAMSTTTAREASEPGQREWREPAFAGFVGVAQRDITPQVGIFARSWGAANWDVTTGTHRPLTLSALAVRAGARAEPLILVSLDGGWWHRRIDEWHVRGAVLEALGLAEPRVVVHLSHTHAGPSLNLGDAAQPGGEFIAPYLKQLRDAAVGAAIEAASTCVGATASWGVGRCDVAARRDYWDGERYLVGFDPDTVADDTVVVGRIDDHRGNVLATLVNYACHPTTLAWQNRAVSPDFIGAARHTVETGTAGAPCIFLQGANGDLAPRWQYVGDPEVADKHGRQLGYAVLSTLEGLLPARTMLVHEDTVESGASLAMWRPRRRTPSRELRATVLDVDVELRPTPPPEALARRWAHLDEPTRRERIRRANLVASIDGTRGPAGHPVWLWRLGDCAVVAHPGEAYSHLQVELRRRFPLSAVIVLNHANASSNGPGWVYLPNAEAYAHDIYQVWQTPLAAGSLERITEAAGDAMELELGFRPSNAAWARPRMPPS